MRAIVLVIDSFGIGALPDAEHYGDGGSNTAVHIGQAVGGVNWPQLKRLGLGSCAQLLGEIIPGCEPLASPLASYGVLQETSPGKDTTTGHWEIAGIQLTAPFPVFPTGPPAFPQDLLDRLTLVSGYHFLGNKAASGTAILEELGHEHLRTGQPIVYTSGDSVFQIAAHEDVLSLEALYQLCQHARTLCDEWSVGRVIARPFRGSVGQFERTAGRHDYSFRLPGPTILDHLSEAGIQTIAVGKITDIFNGQGITQSFPDKGNPACLERTLALVSAPAVQPELIFVNLVDSDMIFGHRRDPVGYHQCVVAIDQFLEELLPHIDATDCLLITADHGCDPTFTGTDHTREHVPLLVYQPRKSGMNLGIRPTFADVAQSLASFFQCRPYPTGVSFF